MGRSSRRAGPTERLDYHSIVKLRLLAVTLLAAVSLAAASELPDLGDAARAVFTPQQERRIGETIMREARNDRSWVDDPELVAYLNALGYRLVANSPDARQPFEFFVLRDPTINAFALPGGYIGIHTGLMLAAQTESELAAVLGHEIAHVTQRHIARLIASQQSAQLTSLAAMAVAILAARANPQVASGAVIGAQALAVQQQLNFTRDMEREADRVGLQILERAGFDVRGMAAFFERLQRANRLLETTAPSYLQTHPLTTERIADVQNRIAELPFRQVRDDPDFQILRARLRAQLGHPREAVAQFEDGLRRGTFASEVAQRYGLVVALIRARDFARAQAELRRLRAIAPRTPLIETLEGSLWQQSGQLERAAAVYRNAQLSWPRYAPLVYEHAETLIELRRESEALQVLAEQQLAFPSDPTLFRLQGRAYSGLGQRLAAARAFSEASALHGRFTLAIEQLELGLKAADGDFFQLSSAEARLRELRTLALQARRP
jgi:predicted Zn-dependent protease